MVATHQPVAGQAGINVGASHAQSMIVIPQGGRSLVVAVDIIGVAKGTRVGSGGIVKQAPFGGIAGWDIVGRRQPPGFRVTIAVPFDMSAMHMSNQGDRSGIRSLGLAHAVGCGPTVDTILRRIGPMQGLVDGEQRGQIVAVIINQIVDPAHADRNVRQSFQGKGWKIKLRIGRRSNAYATAKVSRIGERVCRRTVTPYFRGGESIRPAINCVPDTAREYLLFELTSGDLIGVSRSVVFHDRRND